MVLLVGVVAVGMVWLLLVGVVVPLDPVQQHLEFVVGECYVIQIQVSILLYSWVHTALVSLSHQVTHSY